MNAVWLLALTMSSPADLTGFGSAAASLGGGASVADPAPGAIGFYNPARAAAAKDMAVLFGFTGNVPRHQVDGSRVDIRTARLASLGVVIPFKLTDMVRAGASVAIMTPDKWSVRARALRNDQPRLLLDENRLEQMTVDLAISMAWVLSDNMTLGFGGGIRTFGGATGSGTTYDLRHVEDPKTGVAYDRAEGLITADLPLVTTPIASAFFRMGDLSLGVAMRGEMKFDFAFAILADLTLGGSELARADLSAGLLAIDFYTPMKLSTGISWNRPGYAIHLSLEWHRWSQAPNLSQDYLADIAPEGFFTLSRPSLNHPVFRDIMVPRLGLEKKFDLGGWELALRTGGFYHPSPVREDLEGIFLDQNRFGLGLGVGLTTPAPYGVLPEPLSVDLHGLWTHVQDRTFVLLDASTRSLGGDNYGFGISLTQRF